MTTFKPQYEKVRQSVERCEDSSLKSDQPLGLQVPWWIALRGRDGCPAVERAIIYASGIRWRKRLEELRHESSRLNGGPKSWAEVARVIRIHLSNLTGKGRTTHLSVLDVLLVAGTLGIPCADLIPESYATFIKDVTSRLCDAKTPDEDLSAYAAYWARNPRNPRSGIDYGVLAEAARELKTDTETTEAQIRSVSQKLEKHLGRHRAKIEAMIADGRLP